MFRCKPLAVAMFALWTLFVWGQRLVNIARDETLHGWERTIDFSRAGLFVAIGVAVAVVAVRPMREEIARRIVNIGGWLTIGLWTAQMIGIPLRDHTVAFIVVHLVLGAISISLALWAMRALRDSPTGRASDQPASPQRVAEETLANSATTDA